MHRHHKRALAVIAAASLLDASLGLVFAAADHVSAASGLWFAAVTATTIGYGDVVPHGWTAHLVAVLIMVTALPAVAVAVSLAASGFTAVHVAASEKRVKAHIEQRLREHFRERGDG